MKFLFWLLVMLNIGALAYFNMDKISPPRVVQAKPDMQADKLQLLNATDVAAMPKRMKRSKPRAIPNEPTACYSWGSFRKEQLPSVETILNAMNVPFSPTQDSSRSIRHWVYKPPLSSYEDALAKGRELKALGIKDYFIVQTANMRNAISFGVFQNEDLAAKLMDDLRRKGVRNLVKSVRNQGDSTVTLNLVDVTNTIRDQIKKNKPDYPLANIKKMACPN